MKGPQTAEEVRTAQEERERRRLADLFAECDMDASGTICLEELRIVLTGKGYSDHFVEVRVKSYSNPYVTYS